MKTKHFSYLLFFCFICLYRPYKIQPNPQSSFLPHTVSPYNPYTLISTEESEFSLIFHLKHTGSEISYLSPSNPIIQNLKILLKFTSPNELQFLILDPDHPRWEIPKTEPFPPDPPIESKGPLNYDIKTTDSPFTLKIVRKATGETIFDTSGHNFIFSDRYLELGSSLPSELIFGLGERVHGLKLKTPGTYTIWNQDLPGVVDDGTGGKSTYGNYPVYLMREKGGSFHMVYLRNSNAMDVVLGRESIDFKVIGGVIDLRFFLGDQSPESCVVLFHKYIGGYTIQPFWSFGFHQSRWGYSNSSRIQNVVQKYERNDLPVDGIWMDIDYMEEKNPFTIDQRRYELSYLNEELKAKNKKLIIILDPGIAKRSSSYLIAKNQSLFLSQGKYKTYEGNVWPGVVSIPDFFNPRTKDFWVGELEKLREKVKFDGIWLDMNEISIFNDFQNVRLCDDQSELKLVYLPGGSPIDLKTICRDVRHYDNEKEFNVHNFNGLMEGYLTYKFFREKMNQKFPFILSRSTAAGAGKYVIHWTGDNRSDFTWMKLSIAGILNFNIFGIPNVGADICGFEGILKDLFHIDLIRYCIRGTMLQMDAVGHFIPFRAQSQHSYESG